MSCGQTSRWGCPDVDRFEGGKVGGRESGRASKRGERIGARVRDTRARGRGTTRKLGWVYRRGDCKVVTTELGTGAIGNRLQLSTCINYLLSSYVAVIRISLSLPFSFSPPLYLSLSYSSPLASLYFSLSLPVLFSFSLPFSLIPHSFLYAAPWPVSLSLTRSSCMRPDTTVCCTTSDRAVHERPCLPRGHKIPDSPIASPINRC